MRIVPVLAFAIFCLSFTISEVTRYIYKRDGMHVEYGKEHGMLNSRYVSYWPNGKPKVQGGLVNNMRYGEWQLLDSTGKLLMARNYETGYAWTQMYPITFNEISSKRLFGNRFSLYVDIKPDSVLQSARIWRFLPYNQYSPIFANNAVLDTLIAMRDRGAVIACEDSEMRVQMSYSEFHENLEKSTTQRYMMGFRIMEDWYYDAKKLMAIHGIIAICPVIYARNQKDTVDVGWFPYDATVRNKLALMHYVPAQPTGFPIGVEQTFFLRCFESEVYKYSNVGYRTIAQLYSDKAEREKEIQRMEIQPLEWEHDHWLNVYK